MQDFNTSRHETSTDVLSKYVQNIMDTHGDQQSFIAITLSDHETMAEQTAINLASMSDGLQSRELSQNIFDAPPGDDTSKLFENIEQLRRRSVNNPVAVAGIESFNRTSDSVGKELLAEQLHEQKLCEKLALIKEGLDFLISRGLREISFDVNPESVSHFRLPEAIGPRIMEVVDITRRENLDLRYGEPEPESPTFSV